MLAWDDSGDSGLELDSDFISNVCENSWKLLLVIGSECTTDGALVMGRGRLSRFAFSLGEFVNNLLFTSVSSNSELDVNLSSPAAAALDADRYRLPRLLSSKDTRNFSGRAEKLSGETNLGLENLGRGRATDVDGEAPPLEASLPDDLPSPAPAPISNVHTDILYRSSALLLATPLCYPRFFFQQLQQTSFRPHWLAEEGKPGPSSICECLEDRDELSRSQ